MTLARRCGAHGAPREAAVHAVLQSLRDEAFDQVRVAWADLHGSFRCKTLVGIDAVAAAFDDGVGMVSTLLLKDTADRTAFKVFEPGGLPELPGFAAASNVLMLPDPGSLQRLPWAAGTAWLRAEPWFADGAPVEVDPRRVLQRALATLGDAGFRLRCGLEVEFHIYRITDDGLAVDDAAWPAEPPGLRLLHPGYQLLSEAWTDLADDALAIVRRTALSLDLPLQSLEIELGPSQFEAVFAPTDALTAADQMLLFRNHTRQALRRAGYHASFVCRPPDPPCANAVASGWHLHHSLVDGQGGNAFAADGSSLSLTGQHWLAGLLAHAQGMAALCAPTIPAYSRFQGSLMAPQAAVWGRDNRGAMLRVVGDCPGEASAATRIENRLGEPLANPYLTIAAHVFAGLDGLRRGLQPGAASESPYAPGQPALPATLGAALDALAGDDVLQQGLGRGMSHVLQTVKRQELARYEQATDKAAWLRREYFSRF